MQAEEAAGVGGGGGRVGHVKRGCVCVREGDKIPKKTKHVLEYTLCRAHSPRFAEG